MARMERERSTTFGSIVFSAGDNEILHKLQESFPNSLKKYMTEENEYLTSLNLLSVGTNLYKFNLLFTCTKKLYSSLNSGKNARTSYEVATCLSNSVQFMYKFSTEVIELYRLMTEIPVQQLSNWQPTEAIVMQTTGLVRTFILSRIAHFNFHLGILNSRL